MRQLDNVCGVVLVVELIVLYHQAIATFRYHYYGHNMSFKPLLIAAGTLLVTHGGSWVM